MPRTDAVVNSLGPELLVPLPSGRVFVFLVLNPWEFIQVASLGTVTVPDAYRRNTSFTASASTGMMWTPPGCSTSQRRTPFS